MQEREKTGTFLVSHVDDESVILTDVNDAQIHTLSSNPGFETDEVLKATLEPEPPMNVTWDIAEIETRWKIEIEKSDEKPSEEAHEVAETIDEAPNVATKNIDEGELHVLKIPPEKTEDAVRDVIDDINTKNRAARLGAEKVVVKGKNGVVSVRYD